MLSSDVNLICVGISHHTAPLDVRELLWFSENEVRNTLRKAKELDTSEAVLFSTCNRTELYVVSQTTTPSELKIFLMRQKQCENTISENDLFTLRGGDAVRHLFRVTASIDSMIPGDVQILMQVKQGYSIAQEEGTLGPFLHRIFELAFRAGKRVRTETTIGTGAVSVSTAMIEVAEKIFTTFTHHSALIVGAGEMAELAAVHLKEKNIRSLSITNRTYTKAETIAQRVGASIVPFEQWKSSLPLFDIVLTAIETSEYILTPEDFSTLQLQKTLLLFDIGVPRNIDPRVNEIENVFLYNIDSLQYIVEQNIQHRSKEIPKIEEIIEEELKNLAAWFSSLDVHPTIAALSRFMEQIRKEEVRRYLHRFDEKERELVEMITKRIVNKILHTPINNLKSSDKESLSTKIQKISALHSLFNLTHKNDHGTNE